MGKICKLIRIEISQYYKTHSRSFFKDFSKEILLYTEYSTATTRTIQCNIGNLCKFFWNKVISR